MLAVIGPWFDSAPVYTLRLKVLQYVAHLCPATINNVIQHCIADNLLYSSIKLSNLIYFGWDVLKANIFLVKCWIARFFVPKAVILHWCMKRVLTLWGHIDIVIFSLAAGIHQENLFTLRYFTWHLRFSGPIIRWSTLDFLEVEMWKEENPDVLAPHPHVCNKY